MPSSEEDQAWLFDRGAWSKIVDHIYKSDESDLPDAFRQAGYGEKPVIRLGSIEHGFSVEVYEPAHGKGTPPPRTPYFIIVMIGSAIESIHVADLPSFVMLMDQLSSIAQSILNEKPE